MARHRAEAQLQITARQSMGTIFSALLWLLGLSGFLMVAWLGVSAVTGAHMIHLKTGSMSPTMPTGTLAIIMPTAASTVKAGDVVTVQRENDSLPITHRVITNEKAPPGTIGVSLIKGKPSLTNEDVRMLTLKGDANTFNDFDPYPVGQVGTVIFAVPAAGPILEFLQQPTTMIGMSAVVAALIVYAFWPAPRPHRAQSLAQHLRPRTVPATSHTSTLIIAALASVGLATALTFVSSPLMASPSPFATIPLSNAEAFVKPWATSWITLPENGEEGILTLSTPERTQFHMNGVKAGDQIVWQIQASISPPESALPVGAMTTLELRAFGSMVNDANLEIGIWTCNVPFDTEEHSTTACAGTGTTIHPQERIASTLDNQTSRIWHVGTMSEDSPQYFRFQFTVPASAPVADTTATIGLGFTVTGQHQSPSKDDLADSGFGTVSTHWLAFFLLFCGSVTVTVAAHMKRREI